MTDWQTYRNGNPLLQLPTRRRRTIERSWHSGPRSPSWHRVLIRCSERTSLNWTRMNRLIDETCRIGSFARNLFGIKSEDQAAVAHNEASVEPPAPKTKPATSKPKHPAVAAAGATQPRSVQQPGPSAEPQKTSAQPRKKAKQPAGQNEKAHAKREQEAPRATAPAKGDKPAVQEQAADSISQKPAEAAPTVVPSSRADQPLNAESRNENLVPTAAAAWPIIPNTEGAGAGGAAADTTEAANANAVQLVDPNEVNELDRAASVESSWLDYVWWMLGAALIAAFAMWVFSRMRFLFGRRAANAG